MKKELQRLQDLGVISRVTTPTKWVSQAVCVDKGNGTIRLCIDPRPLNDALQREHYKLLTFDELPPDLAGSKIFSKLDLKSGYWHITLDDASSSSMLTTFQSPFGDRFKWNKLPFGLSVSSEIFQRHIHEALAGLPGVYCIADDIIIAGVGDTTAEATESHDQRLSAFLQCCQEKGIVLNARKFQVHPPRMPFMGYILTPEGIQAR